MNLKKLIFIFVFQSKVLAQVIPPDSIQKDIEESLNFLAAKQCTQTIEGKQYAGEWEASMQMKSFFFLLGLRHKYRDSNCFTMTGIHNILAEMYLADSSQKIILPMLKKSFPEILSYSEETPKEGKEFNFWKKLPPNRDLQWGKEPNPVPLVRRPTTFLLEERFINNAANIQNDADDTAMGNLAIWYHEKIFGKNDSLTPVKTTIFDHYLDKNRKNRNWYNYVYHGFKKSGAYMTWLGQEAEFENWYFLRNVKHFLYFYLPSSICYPHPYQAYIPWGANDVDVVVNANILTYLSKTGLLQAGKGSVASQQLIEKHAKRGWWNRMGIYYPNRYHFHYAVGRALAAGDSALMPTAQLLLTHFAKTQRPNGSFESWRKVNKHDILQSTTYAVLAMLYMREAGVEIPKNLINKSIAYLHHQRKSANGETYWAGGVFFSGGSIVRNTLYFTSDAYTTALIALAFQKYLKH